MNEKVYCAGPMPADVIPMKETHGYNLEWPYYRFDKKGQLIEEKEYLLQGQSLRGCNFDRPPEGHRPPSGGYGSSGETKAKVPWSIG